jgi:hypothetical protein
VLSPAELLDCEQTRYAVMIDRLLPFLPPSVIPLHHPSPVGSRIPDIRTRVVQLPYTIDVVPPVWLVIEIPGDQFTKALSC